MVLGARVAAAKPAPPDARELASLKSQVAFLDLLRRLRIHGFRSAHGCSQACAAGRKGACQPEKPVSVSRPAAYTEESTIGAPLQLFSVYSCPENKLITNDSSNSPDTCSHALFGPLDTQCHSMQLISLNFVWPTPPQSMGTDYPCCHLTFAATFRSCSIHIHIPPVFWGSMFLSRAACLDTADCSAGQGDSSAHGAVAAQGSHRCCSATPQLHSSLQFSRDILAASRRRHRRHCCHRCHHAEPASRCSANPKSCRAATWIGEQQWRDGVCGL